MTDRLELLADVAFELSHARETDKMYDILAANDIEGAEEISACLAAAVIINGKKLDMIHDQVLVMNDIILLQGDKTLLN